MLELKGDWPRTLEEFRVWHERQPEVYEFIDGVPRLMAPGSMPHSLIKGNVYAALRAQLRDSGCHVIVDGAQIEGRTFSVIPDVVVTCSPLNLSTPRVADPVIIVEILSPSTERTT
jgi:Uma2 family endonuclease